jgi:creatinine amidohydrolase
MSAPFQPLEAAHLSWPRVRALAAGGAVALLPVGSTEAHGPHLPLAVDATTRALLTDALAGIARHGFSATLAVNHHLEPAHFRVVHEAAKAAREQTGARILVPDHRRPPTAPLLGREFTHGGSHAGTYETALMLAVAPHLVDQEALAQLPALEVDLPARIKAGARDFHEAGGPDAYFGDPRSATLKEGERLLGLLAEVVLAALDAPAA